MFSLTTSCTAHYLRVSLVTDGHHGNVKRNIERVVCKLAPSRAAMGNGCLGMQRWQMNGIALCHVRRHEDSQDVVIGCNGFTMLKN